MRRADLGQGEDTANKVVYLTGAPATGKSTLMRYLEENVPGLVGFSYSWHLARHVSQRTSGSDLGEDDMRRQSALLIRREDVDAVDAQLIETVRLKRQQHPIVIDSHPVTKEEFGFRVTPFTRAQLATLHPDVILCLYASADEIRRRIETNSMGRPLPRKDEIELHTQTQVSLAVQYGLRLDAPVYLLDAERPIAQLGQNAITVAGLAGVC